MVPALLNDVDEWVEVLPTYESDSKLIPFISQVYGCSHDGNGLLVSFFDFFA